jgi:hypothetical protein
MAAIEAFNLAFPIEGSGPKLLIKSTNSVFDSQNSKLLANKVSERNDIIWIEEVNMLKFVDPRGAKQEGDIFMDEYYDLAKVSHSIFGGYESIIYNTTINYDHIQNLFYNYLNKNKISVELLKVYEASLFLSMTPLHIDKPENVEQFLNKCDKILKEIGC